MYIEIEGLGKRHIVNDKEQIIWFLSELSKKKGVKKIRVFAALKTNYYNGLLVNGAIEIISLIDKSVTVRKPPQSNDRVLQDAIMLLNESRAIRGLVADFKRNVKVYSN